MHSANSTTAKLKLIFLYSSVFFSSHLASAQENSPYSRYGLGDIVPNRNIVSRGMGGISTGYADYLSINLSNPAALSKLLVTNFDIAGEVDLRRLKSNNAPAQFSSVNTVISYLQFAFPLSTPKMLLKNRQWNVGFGLKPVTRINYKIQENERLSGIDSLETLYEGSGGLNQANISTAVRLNNFSFGVSAGYSFGNREYSTRLNFINDTVPYARSTSEANTRFGGLALTLGTQYRIKLKSGGTILLGASANLQQNLKAKKDNLNASYGFNSSGEIIHIDTVSSGLNQKGILNIPATYSAGFTYTDSSGRFTLGADVDYTEWTKFRDYGKSDALANTTVFHVGGQFQPTTLPTTKYWSTVKYRAGFYYGNDYVNINKKRSDYAVTLGAGLPLSFAAYDFVTFNTGIELGQRGNKQNQSIREGFTRIMIGVSVNANTWLRKRKYD